MMDRIDPRDTAFGAVVSGSPLDATQNGIALNLAIQAALAGNLPLYIPTGLGMCVEAAQITTQITDTDFSIFGEGKSSRITVTDNAPLFQIDAATTVYRLEARDFFMDFTSPQYDQTRGFVVHADTEQVGGLRQSVFQNIWFRGGSKFFEAHPSQLHLFAGHIIPGFYGYLTFDGIHVPQAARYPDRVIHFHSGHGADCMLIDSQLRANPVGGIIWESGDGQSVEGDMLIANNRMVLGSYAIRIKGPPAPAYSRGVQIKGNQIDGMTDGVGWLSDIDEPLIDNHQLYGTSADWKLERCRNVDIRDTGAAQGRYGLTDKTAGNGVKKLWRIEKADPASGKGAITFEVNAEAHLPGLSARGSHLKVQAVFNNTAWSTLPISGPVSTQGSSFAVRAIINGDGIDIEAVIAGASGPGPIYGQLIVTGQNRAVSYF